MDNKPDVRAIMARFQAGGTSCEETPSTGPGRPKQLVQPTLSGQGQLMKKPLSESLSGSAAHVPLKPSFLKNTPSSKSDTVVPPSESLSGSAAPFPSKPSFMKNTPSSKSDTVVPAAGSLLGSAATYPPKPSFLKNTPSSKSDTVVPPSESLSGSAAPLPSKPSFMKNTPSSKSDTVVPASESLSGSAATFPPKPSFLKNTPSSKSDTVAQEPNKTKALASKFANSQDDTSKPFMKPQMTSKPSFTQMSEPKAPPNKSALSANGSESKPVFPKPAVVSSKPSWVKEDSAPSVTSPPAPKIPSVQLKPCNSFFKLQQQLEEKAEVNTDTVNKSPLPVNSAIKPPSNFKTAQNLFNKEPEEQSDSGVRPSAVNKLPLTASISTTPPKPAQSKKPSLKKPSPHITGDDPSAPKKNPLPNSLALGPAPAKPNRPPHVNLEAFKRGSETSADGPKKPIAPPPFASHPSNQNPPATPAPPPVPSLPPRHPVAQNQTEEVYDDVDGPSSTPPPLPPVHPSQMSKEKDGDDDEDGEMYEDLDEIWEAAEQKQEKKKEKEDKEEKKRLEAEKKEQKEREKKEQDARKKFKLVGALEILQKGKARVDYKGNKTDLSLKQGESLDIIRIQGNPEGKWLGRTQDGSIGYVKTTSVEIDFNSLKQQTVEQSYEPEVYDDIDVAPPDKSKIKGPGMVLPPLPGEAEEIYDDVDPSLDVRVPPPSQFSGDSDHKGGAIDEEIYDDVDSQNMPPPSTISNSKVKEVDPKKQKKLEKEEKEFRKKFKYEGEIHVLHQVTIIPNLTNKKWSSKELALKAGEKLDVIVNPVDSKFICRNEEGKFGYVSTSYVVTDDGDIYDDIGDDCIYDND